MADRTSSKRQKVKQTPSRSSSDKKRRESPLLAKNARNGAPIVTGAHSPAGKHFLSDKVSHFTESVIREMTRQAMMYNAVNLAQGFPDFSAPAAIKQAAQQAVATDVNQYAITWGAKNLRNAIPRQMGVWQGITVDPEKEITVCCGSTEAMISTLLAVCNTG